ncbi:hypothetical protein [Geminocystis sp. NIES-3709]|uniref:hypothetical protein n=1 Tax=Geminocystis sp. NIES-3709 TaxID=1617448 RepID=UPI0005FC4FBA|nr:hypothetical protein [Geminocystis sp. NIES-3709]BAQ65927.1 hypothetical protein GM3709_2692 [Geminocystis sp. NIES-3709]
MEKIVEIIPNGNLFTNIYKNILGLKLLTDEAYKNHKNNQVNVFNYFKQDFFNHQLQKKNIIKLRYYDTRKNGESYRKSRINIDE